MIIHQEKLLWMLCFGFVSPGSGAFSGLRDAPEALFIIVPLGFGYSEPYLTFG
jgi:hypothetical protein